VRQTLVVDDKVQQQTRTVGAKRAMLCDTHTHINCHIHTHIAEYARTCTRSRTSSVNERSVPRSANTVAPICAACSVSDHTHHQMNAHIYNIPTNT
jgi:hypothetical protein